MNAERWKQFVLFSICAAVASIVMGLIFFGDAIFVEMRTAFQFLSFGIAGGILFSSFRILKKWMAAIVFVALLLMNEVIVHRADTYFIWQDALYFVALSAALFVFAQYYFSRLSNAVFGRVLALSSLVAGGYVVVTVIFYLVFAADPSMPRFALPQMIYYDLAQGYLLGFGLGAGIEAGGFVIKRTASVSEQPGSNATSSL